MGGGQPVSPAIWLVLAAALLLPVAVALLPDSDERAAPLTTSEPARPAIEYPAPPPVPEITYPTESTTVATAPTEAAANEPVLPAIDGEEWRATHGYFTAEEQALYASYTDEATRQLAATGDLLAAEVMFNRYVAAGNWQAARLAAMVGAVHGSTAALGLVADFHENLGLRREDKYPSQAKFAWMGALAALEVALMRGDPTVYERGIGIIRSKNLTLSEDDLKEISKTASSLYRRLEREREALGLSPFDDPPVERYSGRVTLDETTPWGGTLFAPKAEDGDEG